MVRLLKKIFGNWAEKGKEAKSEMLSMVIVLIFTLLEKTSIALSKKTTSLSSDIPV